VVAADPATAHLLRFSHPLPGGAVAHTLHAWTDQAELNKYDCFPSGHTEVSLVVLVACWRYWRKAFPFFLAAVSGLLVGTLYLRYHYGIDIVAGALLAWWIVSAFPQWNQAWIEHRDRLPGGRRSADA
jgi:membrane-associated phospholipid phosphatase